MIVATAGHIDHGKTTLVRALTGTDTDRLPEEKARGISIDLGFAYATLPDGGTLGFVDVPGHERFVRNMLAGVCAIDFVMMIVAADDGVMPQTVEHFNIVDLLAVPRGVVVITKIDRVDADRLAAVEAQVSTLVAGSRLSGIECVRVSATAGTGIEQLRQVLVDAAKGLERTRVDGRGFRFVVDRAFSVAGSGTVLTGTVIDGQVRAGDRLHLSSNGLEVRVRGLQQAGQAVPVAVAGERTAINVTGADLQAVGRGDWLVERLAPTDRLDVRLQLLPADANDKPYTLGHWSRVHLHIGAAYISAHVSIPGGKPLQPGNAATVQLVLDQKIAASFDDRFVLRDQSSTRTIGGGSVLDPHAPKRRGNAASRVAFERALTEIDPGNALRTLAGLSPNGIGLRRFGDIFNLRDEAIDNLVRHQKLEVLSHAGIVLTPEVVAQIGQAIVEQVGRFHREEPQVPGIETTALHLDCASQMQASLFEELLHRLAPRLELRITGSRVRAVSHQSTENPRDKALWERLHLRLDDAGLKGMTVTELSQDLRVAESVLEDLLHRKVPTREAVRVTPQRFYLTSTMAQSAEIAARVAAAASEGLFTAAQYRDAVGLNRVLSIHILEALDRLQVTTRIGDARRIRQDYRPILGQARPVHAAVAPEPSPKPTPNVHPPGSGRPDQRPSKR